MWARGGPWLAISSAPLGGGLGPRHWVINTTVPSGYDRIDPDRHLSEIADELGLAGRGIGLMTAVDVAERVTEAAEGLIVTATVGLGEPEHAAGPGTINLVAYCPVRLSDAALVNAVATATEAKAQALWALGLEATGTATDAVSVLCPLDGPAAPYGGPRSTWGSRLARAVYAAVLRGGRVAPA